jgi:uncharacterized membrane protein YhaH (DUF805 family)
VKRWLSFAGRASRREYWARTVVAMAVFFSSGVLLLVLAGIGEPWLAAHLHFSPLMSGLFVLAVLALLALETVIYIWAVLAVSVRRLHDLGFSGPAGFRSTSASVRACFARGTVGPNEFGPDPLG